MQVFTLRVPAFGVAAGLAFALLDALLNANPVAARLLAVYRPITRASINAPLGLAFDVVSGVVMAYLYVFLTPALPGGWIAKGIVFGLIAWFFRVAMGVASQAIMFRVPPAALMYTLLTGLAEMALLGLFLAAVLKTGA